MDKIMIPHGAQEILETLQFNGYEAKVSRFSGNTSHHECRCRQLYLGLE